MHHGIGNLPRGGNEPVSAALAGRQIPFFYYLIYNFIFSGCSESSLPCRLFSSCGEQGLLSRSVHRLLIAVASLIVEHRL